MLSLPHNTRIFLHVLATDLRKSFEGLGELVRSAFEVDPCDGSWFLFFNRCRDRVKVLYWDRDGLELWYKRLEAGTCETSRAVGDAGTGCHATAVVAQRRDVGIRACTLKFINQIVLDISKNAR